MAVHRAGTAVDVMASVLTPMMMMMMAMVVVMLMAASKSSTVGRRCHGHLRWHRRDVHGAEFHGLELLGKHLWNLDIGRRCLAAE